MPDSGLGIPLGVPPQDYQSYLQAQRRAMLAQALTQQAAAPLQAPETAPVRGLYVQPRVGVGSIVGKLGQALLANRETKRAMQSQAGLMQAMEQAYAPGGQGAPDAGASQPPAAPPAQDAPPMIRATPDQLAASGQPQEMPQAAQPAPTQPQSVNPRNPSNLPADVVARMAIANPADYAKYLQGTPEWQNALRAAGGNPAQAMALLHAQQVKAGTTEARPGGWVQGPDGQWTQLPQGGPGQHLQFGPHGELSSSTIPGYNEQAQALAAAEAAGRAGSTPHYVEDPFNPGHVHTVYPQPPPGAQPAAAPTQAPGAAPPGAPPPAAAASPPAGGGTSAADLEEQKLGAKAGVDYQGELSENATGAREVRRSLAELRNLAAQATPSAANKAKMTLGSYLIAAGMSPQSVANSLGVDIGALQAAQKQTATLAVNTIHSMTNRGTNFDLDTFMKNNPNLNMSDPTAFNRVVDYMDTKAQSEVDKLHAFTRWKQGQRPDNWEPGFEDFWNQKQTALIDAGKTNSPRPQSSQTPTGPVHVSSPEEAERLPKGTHFITPDGRELVRH